MSIPYHFFVIIKEKEKETIEMKLTSSTPTAKHDRWKNDDFMLKNQVMICGDYQIELLIPFLIMRAVVVGEVMICRVNYIKLKTSYLSFV